MKLSKLFISLMGVAFSATVLAQAFPNKPVTIVVPFPPGGSTDQMARAIAPKLQSQWGQGVLVDNKAGATGTIGATFVKRAAPDGYTLFVTSLGPLVIVPYLIPNLQYDPAKDFDFLTVGLQSPNVLVVPTNSPYKTVGDLVAAMKANPNKITFSSAGTGSSDHLTAEILWDQTNTEGVHVPYKGGAPAITDLIGGTVDAQFANVNAVIQYINAGKLRPLAMTGSKRSPVIPNTPTMKEAGVNDMVIYSWQAALAPKGLPADVKDKIAKGIVSALNDPQVKKGFIDIGFEVVANTPEQFAKFQAEEAVRWKKLIESRKITAN
ncbi:tripartite tricarboxylate transporter substrate binding protein [Polynucleobacter sp. MWH-Aus1W21]|uniref:Bug family tripartite tricarboxylate transporter substrate binding protein n=1 Tax=Polynucleobacter sp. MWH-Aus1W21 TaxID=1855880 RepID=UPI001BFDBD7E|nr:tripartite tricarboxylate transporter substrate binding protein [Polynucleobacter sp. MWH-Aus1W21]QWD65347.1 tripartite tricarboxylate transporter substrate binding protein [Polynucleobacter sp. MWH-Aus1W21]